jgi:[ribosomal protein S5]-alanine N-acetyltransferase
MKKLAFLKGKKLYLRQLQPEDIEGDYVQWFNDPEVCQFNSHHTFPYGKEKAADYINNVANSKTDLVLAIIANDKNKHIGNVSLQNINFLAQNAEFAIVIGDKNYWGKGYSKEASRLIIEHGFLELNLHRIYCGTSAENLPMQGLAKSLGMKKEGQRKDGIFKHGKFQDIFEYGILAKEYFNN